MSEEAPESGSGPDTSGLALDLAMEEARSDPGLREDVAAFLRNQNSLIDIQKHHLLKQFALTLWEKRLGVLLRIATAFMGLVVAAGFAYLIWNAAHSNDLVLDTFQVPPELAARGLSGPVLAAKLSDKIAAMQAQTTSQRAPKSYANGISDGLKLEIPETGVSLSELDRFLREKLGHDLHIGGELVQQDKAIALTVRAGGTGSATVTGTEAEMDSLLQKLAEQVYRFTQPYRFSVWLQAQGRLEEGIAVLKQLAASGPASERAWAYNGWGIASTQGQGDQLGADLLRRGLALDPDNYLLAANIAAHEAFRGHTEENLRGMQHALALLAAHGANYALADRLETAAQGYRSIALVDQGALLEAAEQSRRFRGTSTVNNTPNFAAHAEILAALHEPAAAEAFAAENPTNVTNVANAGTLLVNSLRSRMPVALEKQDWLAVLAIARDFPLLAARFHGLAEIKSTMFDPLAALALAHLGRFVEAEALLKPLPSDCYPCLRARAQVAALQGQDARADFWFARAAAAGPSLPHAESEWGRALLARGKPDDAVAKFTLSNKKGPHFADPLEGWGEALMAKNQSHLALAKFQQAEKYAPNWGRLHLKWGEALAYAGKPGEAKKQFARAAQLDLPPPEKAELARVSQP